jgi:hypothetical protein
LSGFDPRTAIFRAREAHREKLRAMARASRQPAVEPAPALVAPPIQDAEATEEELEIGGATAEGIGSDPPLSAAAALADVAGPSAPAAGAVPAGGVAAFADQPLAPPEGGRHSPRPEPRASSYRPPATGGVCAPDTDASDDAPLPAAGAGGMQANAGLPAWFRTDLPRLCRACRDFRPAAEGPRGWCANRWAFTHRQMVREDDVAPCRSAIGDWWAPVDDVWLVAADVSAHGRATPLLDRLLEGEPGQRRRS